MNDIPCFFDIHAYRGSSSIDVFGDDALENVEVLHASAFHSVGPAKIDHAKDEQALIDRLECLGQRLVANERDERFVELSCRARPGRRH